MFSYIILAEGPALPMKKKFKIKKIRKKIISNIF